MAWDPIDEIVKLDRNDIDAALEFAKKAMERGLYGFEVAEMLHMLQDDMEPLSEQIDQLVSANPQYKKTNPILADAD